MKILLLGGNGQVGWECRRSLSTMGFLEVHDRKTADFLDLDNLRKVIRLSKPDVIVNAVAFTAVDQAEIDTEEAYIINTKAVSLLAEEANLLNACLIHYSTDYVFDGTKSGFYSERDEANPKSIYGQTKHDGELSIIDSGCLYFIFRTSWVYAARGKNFAKTMLRVAQEREELKVVADQFGAPTSAELIADVTAQLIHQLRVQSNFAELHSGIYNLAASGQTSWFEYAKRVLAKAEELGLKLNIGPDDVIPITSADYPQAASRPQNSGLNTSKLTDLLNIIMPSWEVHIERMVTEILETDA